MRAGEDDGVQAEPLRQAQGRRQVGVGEGRVRVTGLDPANIVLDTLTSYFADGPSFAAG